MLKSKRFRPPSSSGPGRGPLKAKTRIRIPLGALYRTHSEQLSENEQFIDLVRFTQRSQLDELPADWKKVGRDPLGYFLQTTSEIIAHSLILAI